VTIAQAHSLSRHGRHCRGSAVVDHAKAQPVDNEQHNVVRPRGLRLRHSGRVQHRLGQSHLQGYGNKEKRSAHDELQGKK
jgi:hypothetical protein